MDEKPKKVVFRNGDTGEVLQEWELNPSQLRFWTSKKKYVLFSGGYGCVAGNTKILDADTGEEKEIQNITSPFRVFSHNGKKALALVPVKYPKERLFKVKTENYEITGTVDHKILTPSGWQKIYDLSVFSPILVSSPFLPYSISESFLSVLFSSVLHWLQKVQGFLFYCRFLFRFYGAQLLLSSKLFQVLFPLSSGVLLHNRDSWQKDARSFSPKYTQIYQQSDPLSKNDFSPFEKHLPVSNGADYNDESTSEHISGKDQSKLKVLWNSFCHRIKGLGVLYNLFYAYPYPTIKEEKIQSISYEGVDNYYDLHILGTNSYYAQGFFHHNCGKSLMLTLKATQLALKYPKNYILMGRRTYPELRDTLLKEFFNYIPDVLIKDYLKAEGRVIFHNDSEIIFRHLDTIAESEIRSLNLGAAFIDQGEDISKDVFIGLRGRLRRDVVTDDADRKICITCNPALTWLYSDFKQSPEMNPDGTTDFEVIEASTLENIKHLPKSYVDDLLKYPESYKKQYVYGLWDEDLLSNRAVFAREYLERLKQGVREPDKVREGLEVFAEYNPAHRYQMGIDAAEGIYEVGVRDDKQKSDESAFTIVDLTTEEEVASWSGRIPPDAAAEKALDFAYWYSDKKNPIMLVPEMNSIGLALLNRLNRESSTQIRIYRREEFDKRLGIKQETEGWRTTRQTKPLLVSRFQELLRLRDPKIRNKKTLEQFKSFVYTTDANKQGMGAELGFHDDRLISALLGFWQKAPVVYGQILGNSKIIDDKKGMKIKNGKIMSIPQLQIERPEKKWTIA